VRPDVIGEYEQNAKHCKRAHNNKQCFAGIFGHRHGGQCETKPGNVDKDYWNCSGTRCGASASLAALIMLQINSTVTDRRYQQAAGEPAMAFMAAFSA